MSEIKKCPFCGAELELTENDSYYWHPFTGCFIDALFLKNNETRIAKWNTRKPMERIVERLEEAKFPQKFGGKTEMMILADKAIEIVKEECEALS